MNLNPAAILALIGSLYEQLAEAQAQLAEARSQLEKGRTDAP